MPNKRKIAINQSRLFKVSSPERLAKVLGTSLQDLRDLCALDLRYREFDIPKAGGKLRHCEDPVPALKAVHGRIASALSQIEAPDFLFCPVKGRSYISNAAAHRHNRAVRCLDIKRFFPSTPSRRVFWFFKTVMGLRGDAAGLLTDLATFKGRLPTGSPLSPILAYFAFHDMWAEIAAFCKSRDYVLTVYIDDVTVSGQKVPLSDLWYIKTIIRRYGLEYHKEKSFIDRPAEITGVILRDGAVSAPHRQHQKRKAASEALRGGAIDIDVVGRQLKGLEGQLRQIARFKDA
ncbi:reverse transcriptase family protein [Sphingomonas sp. 4RDLI-65]|uniref:reverse transcriptase family protein n=1 Tax=Sphingomonas sp. 4RDLI-65 TaxID=3111641 RepID=UPI003C16878A